MLTEIKMKNFKGNTLNQKLTGMDIFTGHNGTGKSSRLHALNYAILGYIPKDIKNSTKPLAETFKNSSDHNSITAGLKLNNFSFERSILKKITKKRNGDKEESLIEDIIISPSKGEKTATQKQARIGNEIGNLPVMLDFGQFLDLTDSDRRKFIFNLTSYVSLWDIKALKKYLSENLLTTELQINNPEKYELMEKLIVDALTQYPKNFDIQMGLQSISEWCLSKLAYWKEEGGNSEALIKKFSEIRNENNETDFNIEGNKQRLNELQLKMVGVEKNITSSFEKNKMADNRYKKIQELQLEINKCKSIIDGAESAESINQQINKLKSTIVDENINKEIDTIIEIKHQLNLKIQDKAEKLSELKNLGTAKSTIIDTYTETIKAIQNQAGKCPLDNRINCNNDFTGYITKTSQIIKKETVERDNLRKEYSKCNAELIELKKELINTENQEVSFRKTEKELRLKNINIKNEIAELEKKSYQVEDYKKLNIEKISIKQDALKSLKNELAEMENFIPIDMLKKERDSIKNNLNQLDELIKKQEKAKNDSVNLKKAFIQNKAAENNIFCLKNLLLYIGPKGAQGQIVKETLEPLRESIQVNLNALQVNCKFYFDCETAKGKEIFQFGWIDPIRGKINFDTLSDGQKMLLLVSFIISIIEKANPLIKILQIDNIQNLDEKNIKKLLTGLSSLSKKLDNILIAGIINKQQQEMANKLGFKVWDVENLQMQENKEIIQLDEAI